jgi:hypothetical protein
LAKVLFLLRTGSRTGCSISLVAGGSMHRSPLSPLNGVACRAMEGLKNPKPDTAAHHRLHLIQPDNLLPGDVSLHRPRNPDSVQKEFP